MERLLLILAGLVLAVVAVFVAVAAFFIITTRDVTPVAVSPGGEAAVNGITIVGEGKASAVPDIAEVGLGVISQGPTAQAASDQNALLMQEVVNRLRQAGINPEDIQTGYYNVRPLYEQGRDVREPRIVGYEVSNTVNVTVRNIANTGQIIDAAIAAGANVGGGIRFRIHDETELRAHAIDLAIQDARRKAETMANSLGRRLGAAKIVTEEGISVPPIYGRTADMAAAQAETPIEPGQLEVVARVRVTFEIQ